MRLPQLYATTSTGGIKTWMIETNGPQIITHHGALNGKMIKKIDVAIGKNIGKSNATTPEQQAGLEAKAKWDAKKSQKKYQETIPGDDQAIDQATAQILLPMLAQNFRKRAHDIVWPAYAQPKFKGVRCLAKKINETVIEFTSRKGKSYTAICQHLIPDLLKIMRVGDIFDGELYVHGWTEQKIVRTTKKLRSWGNELEFHVYDLANVSLTNRDRIIFLSGVFKIIGDRSNIKQVETIFITNAQEVKALHDELVREGYEGVILRNASALYKFDHRSKDLQKYKEFIDSEFKIVGGEAEHGIDANGNEYDAIVFVLKTEDGKIFKARPKGTIKQRVHWMKNIDKLIGKEMTVRYFELSEDGIPTGNTVGLPDDSFEMIVRDYE